MPHATPLLAPNPAPSTVTPGQLVSTPSCNLTPCRPSRVWRKVRSRQRQRQRQRPCAKDGATRHSTVLHPTEPPTPPIICQVRAGDIAACFVRLPGSVASVHELSSSNTILDHLPLPSAPPPLTAPFLVLAPTCVHAWQHGAWWRTRARCRSTAARGGQQRGRRAQAPAEHATQRQRELGLQRRRRRSAAGWQAQPCPWVPRSAHSRAQGVHAWHRRRGGSGC